MPEPMFAHLTASISELKKDPMGTVNSAHGEPLAILNRNHPVFYCISAKTYAQMLKTLEDLELADLIRSRSGEKEISVNIDDL